VEGEPAARLVGVLVEMIHALGVEERRTALDAVDLLSLLQQELGEVGTVLPGDAGNEGFFLHGLPWG
jgi:hypothetical protein